MSDPVYINDGMQREFVIEREIGIHGQLSGTRRIMTDEQVQQYKRKTSQLYERQQAPAAERLRNKLIADQLVEWSIDKPITPEHVARLQPVLLSKLEGLVCGVSPDGVEDLDEDGNIDPQTDHQISGSVAGN